MSIQPIRDNKGNLIIKGAVVGSEIWNGTIAVVLLLKLEQFEKLMPIDDPSPHWEPLMPLPRAKPDGNQPAATTGADPASSAVREVPPASEPFETDERYRMLQIAIPIEEALKLGWGLMETAREIRSVQTLQPKH